MDGLTVTPSLRAVEKCDRVEHRSPPLQGTQGYASNRYLVNWNIRPVRILRSYGFFSP